MAKGTIYILKNKSFNKRLKIGKTKRHILYRIDELNGTNLPNDYQAVALFEVADIDKAETVVFKLFREYRFNREREFFDISEKDAVLHVGAALGVKPHYLCKSLRKDFTSKDSVEDRPRVRQPVATLSKPLLRQPSTPTNASIE